MTTLADIEALTNAYEESREELKNRVWLLNEDIVRLKKERMPAIREAISETANRKQVLHLAVAESRGLFVKPKTRIIMGIKVGFAKLKGKLSWDSEKSVIERIKARFKDEKARRLYIKTTEKPIKKNLEKLPADELKKLGITVSETGDGVVIQPTSNEIDKLVDALLGNAEEEAGEMGEAA
jgi:hypothetical protein